MGVALGIIAIPLVDACAGHPRGLAACLHDMAERKFDLRRDERRPVVEVAPDPPPSRAIADTPPAEPVGAGQAQQPTGTQHVAAALEAGSAPESPVPAPGSAAPVPEIDTGAAPAGRGGPLLLPADEAVDSGRQDVALAATIEPVTDPVAGPTPADTPPIPPAVVPLPPADPRPETQVANAEPLPPAPAPPVAAPIEQPPTIDAIELEGDASYISGSGPAGALIRLYADGELMGESPVEEGRWLVETGAILTQPKRELRIEAIEPGSGRLLGQAAITVEIQAPADAPATAPVPEGALAPDAAPALLPPASGTAPAPPREPIGAATPATPEGDASAVVDPIPEVAAPNLPPVGTTSTPSEPAGNSEAATAPPLAADRVRPVEPSTPAQDESGDATPAGEPLPAIAAIVPRAGSASVQVLSQPGGDPDTVLPAYVAHDDGSVVELPLPDAPALVAEFQVPRAQTGAGSVTILRLVPFGDPVDGRYTGGKALIRRGDTLWSIAHRYYGSGLHYRTIFKANRDLIARPSRIFPGQVFDLPLVTED